MSNWIAASPMYDPLYTRLAEFEEREGLKVETVVAPAHPDLNEQIEAEFASGAASYDLISTHTKYAPSQRQWITPLDDDLDDGELEPFTPRTLELARIDGSLYSVPRNLDVKLLLYRTDFMEYSEAPTEMVEHVRAMQDACREFDVTLAAVALQFSLKDPRIASTSVGMSRPERVEQTLDLATHPIPAELRERIDALASPYG